MFIRKLRFDRGWSQETLAELSGLSVRTVQRIERGGTASLETLGALAAAFEMDIAELTTEMDMYNKQGSSEEEREAMEYVRDIKGFYSHLALYVTATAAMGITNLFIGSAYPWFLWPALGWGMGVAAHGVSVFEVFSVFGVDWERRQVEKRLQRNRG
ncbi:2TM domain-containing protein [Hoeflea prorocentri]|uniref:2TM domain-containing protein n=1 Tax=Hoeflea prorocentri TaxID=1922333 RepID=A0A9X3ZJD0_9HYPH|nr:2TM domain-containing protein [Hoeflea prorocentri]MCY6382948.1 2TM domain-containing protein [Hoeflea prorocentri]MDA5400748.1 2TM domain-containing protein [Hoeflea prorocentri]